MDANEFGNQIDSILGMYHPDVTRVQLNLLDSHDTPRFLTCAGHDLNSLKLALTFLFTYPGAPCLFYGDEIGLYGRQDPECRQPFPWDESKWNHDLRNFVKELIALRKGHPALRGEGSYKKLYAADGVYVFQRASESETILVALNAAETASNVPLNKETANQRKGKLLFGQAEFKADSENIQLKLPPRAGAILKI